MWEYHHQSRTTHTLVISTEGALLRRSGEIPALAFALAFAFAFLSVIPAGNLLLHLPLLLPFWLSFRP
jgi:hypothetical protein